VHPNTKIIAGNGFYGRVQDTPLRGISFKVKIKVASVYAKEMYRGIVLQLQDSAARTLATRSRPNTPATALTSKPVWTRCAR